MSFIKLQDKVPPVYPEGSRDFQLFCHLYDVIFNGVKDDIDGIQYLTNTESCRSNMLQLLQTKLGFFTHVQYADEALWRVLQAFPLLVRKKGTLAAIEGAVYLFLKTAKLETTVKIDIINNEPTQEQKANFGSYITDHSIIIGIESSIRDISLLKEILYYIIPFGYNLFFYFLVQGNIYDNYVSAEKFEYAIVGNDLNSALKGSTVPGCKDPYPLSDISTKVSYSPHKVEYNNSEISFSGYEWADLWYDNDDTKDYTSEFARRQLNAINTVEIVPQGIMNDEVHGQVEPKEAESIFDVKVLEDTFDKVTDDTATDDKETDNKETDN